MCSQDTEGVSLFGSYWPRTGGARRVLASAGSDRVASAWCTRREVHTHTHTHTHTQPKRTYAERDTQNKHKQPTL